MGLLDGRGMLGDDRVNDAEFGILTPIGRAGGLVDVVGIDAAAKELLLSSIVFVVGAHFDCVVIGNVMR